MVRLCQLEIDLPAALAAAQAGMQGNVIGLPAAPGAAQAGEPRMYWLRCRRCGRKGRSPDPPERTFFVCRTGLGDRLARALAAVGVTKCRYSIVRRNVLEALGFHRAAEQPCGCAERQEKLNRIGEWIIKICRRKKDSPRRTRRLKSAVTRIQPDNHGPGTGETAGSRAVAERIFSALRSLRWIFLFPVFLLCALGLPAAQRAEGGAGRRRN